MKKIAALLALIMTVSVFPVTAFAAGYSDVYGHWAQEYINTWSLGSKPVLYGYGNGLFGPEDPIKDVDLTLITDRILGAEGRVWINSPVLTREQAFKKIAQAFSIEPKTNITQAERFTDHEQISADCLGYIYALKSRGLVSGMGGNSFSPKSNYTRAQALTVVYNMVGTIVDSSADITSSSYAKSVVVRRPGITFKGVTFENDLIIGQGVGDGEITLDGVTVNGSLIVLGGGMNSVNIQGKSKINNIIGAKRSGQFARINVNSDSTLGGLSIADNGKIIFNGEVDSVKIGASATLELAADADINNVNINGANSQLVTNRGAAVALVNVTANGVKVTGNGAVDEVQVSGSVTADTTVSTPRTDVENDGDADVVDDNGRTVAASGRSSTTTSSGSASGSSSGYTSSPGRGSSYYYDDDDYTALRDVTVDIDAPEVGEEPQHTYSSQRGYQSGRITWRTSPSSNWDDDEDFKAGYRYIARITLDRRGGYRFTSSTDLDVDPYVSGMDIDEIRWSSSSKTWEIEYPTLTENTTPPAGNQVVTAVDSTSYPTTYTGYVNTTLVQLKAELDNTVSATVTGKTGAQTITGITWECIETGGYKPELTTAQTFKMVLPSGYEFGGTLATTPPTIEVTLNKAKGIVTAVALNPASVSAAVNTAFTTVLTSKSVKAVLAVKDGDGTKHVEIPASTVGITWDDATSYTTIGTAGTYNVKMTGFDMAAYTLDQSVTTASLPALKVELTDAGTVKPVVTAVVLMQGTSEDNTIEADVDDTFAEILANVDAKLTIKDAEAATITDCAGITWNQAHVTALVAGTAGNTYEVKMESLPESYTLGLGEGNELPTLKVTLKSAGTTDPVKVVSAITNPDFSSLPTHTGYKGVALAELESALPDKIVAATIDGGAPGTLATPISITWTGYDDAKTDAQTLTMKLPGGYKLAANYNPSVKVDLYNAVVGYERTSADGFSIVGGEKTLKQVKAMIKADVKFKVNSTEEAAVTIDGVEWGTDDVTGDNSIAFNTTDAGKNTITFTPVFPADYKLKTTSGGFTGEIKVTVTNPSASTPGGEASGTGGVNTLNAISAPLPASRTNKSLLTETSAANAYNGVNDFMPLKAQASPTTAGSNYSSYGLASPSPTPTLEPVPSGTPASAQTEEPPKQIQTESPEPVQTEEPSKQIQTGTPEPMTTPEPASTETTSTVPSATPEPVPTETLEQAVPTPTPVTTPPVYDKISENPVQTLPVTTQTVPPVTLPAPVPSGEGIYKAPGNLPGLTDEEYPGLVPVPQDFEFKLEDVPEGMTPEEYRLWLLKMKGLNAQNKEAQDADVQGKAPNTQGAR